MSTATSAFVDARELLPTGAARTLPRGPFPGSSGRKGPAESLRSVVAGIARELGRRTLYVGTPDAARGLRADARAASHIPPEDRFSTRPLGPIARAARSTFRQLFAQGCEDLAVLGVMALPEAVSQAMLQAGHRGARVALIVEGVDVADPDVRFAVEGIRALADRTGTPIAIFP